MYWLKKNISNFTLLIITICLSGCLGHQIGQVKNQIVFASDRQDGNYDIWLMNEDGSEPVNLTADNDADDSYPCWSPDGTKIVFGSDRDGDWEIYVMAADGSNVRQLTHNNGWDGHASWSPDGNRIVWARDVFAISLMNYDGNYPHDVIPPRTMVDVYHPRFSPDGEWIYFISDKGHYALFELWKVHPDGTGLTPVYHTGEHHEGCDFSPTNPNLLCVGIDPTGRSDKQINFDLVLVDTTNGQHKKITNTPAPVHEGWPSYSPDGARMVFTCWTKTSSDICTMRTDGTERIILTQGARNVFPDWCPVDRSPRP